MKLVVFPQTQSHKVPEQGAHVGVDGTAQHTSTWASWERCGGVQHTEGWGLLPALPWLAAVPAVVGWGGVKGLWGQSELPAQVGDGNGRWRNHRRVTKGLGWVSLAKKRLKGGLLAAYSSRAGI